MASLPKGYVIPRLVAGDRVASVARGGLDSAAGAGAVHDYDSQHRLEINLQCFERVASFVGIFMIRNLIVSDIESFQRCRGSERGANPAK